MYKDRIYSINEVGVSGVKHLGSRDFSEVIAKAKSCKGFPKTISPPEYHTVGEHYANYIVLFTFFRETNVSICMFFCY